MKKQKTKKEEKIISLEKKEKRKNIIMVSTIVGIGVLAIGTCAILDIVNHKKQELAKLEENIANKSIVSEEQINRENNEQEASLNENSANANNANVNTANSNVLNTNSSNNVSGSKSSESKKPKALVEDEKITVYTDSNNEQAPIPRGYTVSSVEAENKVKTGLVIYEGTNTVTSSNLEDAQKTRNQWVWVPVPIASEMYGTDANRKKMGKEL